MGWALAASRALFVSKECAAARFQTQATVIALRLAPSEQPRQRSLKLALGALA